MQSQATLKHHAGLVDRMASHVGIDLQEAALRGQITISEIEDAVLRCTGCAQTHACEATLNAGPASDGTAPGYCRNADVFAALQL